MTNTFWSQQVYYDNPFILNYYAVLFVLLSVLKISEIYRANMHIETDMGLITDVMNNRILQVTFYLIAKTTGMNK